MPKVKVPWLCSRSQPGIKVIIRDLRGHLLHTVTFLVFHFFLFEQKVRLPMLKFDRSFHKQSLCQPYCVSYLDQFTQTFSAVSEINNGINGTP